MESRIGVLSVNLCNFRVKVSRRNLLEVLVQEKLRATGVGGCF